MEMIIGIWGIIKAGGAYVPINPEYPENRIRYILEDSAPKAVLTYKVEAPQGTELRQQLHAIPVLDLGDKNTYADTTDNLPRVNSPSDLIYCIYTSGTTGSPKGVLIEHRNVVNMWVTYHAFSINTEDTVLQFASMSFDQAVGDIFPTLCNGAALCLIPSHIVYDMDKLQKYMHENRVTIVSLTPKVIKELSIEKLPTLRLLESGGEAGDLSSLKEWQKK
jgi:non-ribosomal peptide synthetase component F